MLPQLMRSYTTGWDSTPARASRKRRFSELGSTDRIATLRLLRTRKETTIMVRARLLRAFGSLCIGVLASLVLPTIHGSPAFASVRPGALYAAGLNGSGQLGLGEDSGPQICNTEPCSTEPVTPALPAGVRSESLAAGGSVAYAIG